MKAKYLGMTLGASALGMAAVMLTAANVTGCGSTFDCAQICDNYETCVDSNLDESSCVDACENFADQSTVNEQLVEDCEDCLDNTACAESGPCAEFCDPVLDASLP